MINDATWFQGWSVVFSWVRVVCFQLQLKKSFKPCKTIVLDKSWKHTILLNWRGTNLESKSWKLGTCEDQKILKLEQLTKLCFEIGSLKQVWPPHGAHHNYLHQKHLEKDQIT